MTTKDTELEKESEEERKRREGKEEREKHVKTYDVIPDVGKGVIPDDVIRDGGGKGTYDVIPDSGPDSGPCDYCFPPGTRVEMADGSLWPIEEIRLGDRVRSWDLQWGVLAEGCVERVLTGTADRLIRLNGRLSASPAHRILSTRGYLRFDEVESGDLLLRSSGSGPELVASVEVIPGDHRVHNLVVVPHASFIAEGLLVEDQDGEESPRLVEAVVEEVV